MSGIERERKFLVRRNSGWQQQTTVVSHIQQGYIPADGVTVRVRLRDARGYLTIKGCPYGDGLQRYEFEKEITMDETLALLTLCREGVVEKERYLLRYEGHLFEIDVFHGDNEGLVIAEVELADGDNEVALPSFLGPEVSHDERFRNTFLAQHPFVEWKESVPSDYR